MTQVRIGSTEIPTGTTVTRTELDVIRHVSYSSVLMNARIL